VYKCAQPQPLQCRLRVPAARSCCALGGRAGGAAADATRRRSSLGGIHGVPKVHFKGRQGDYYIMARHAAARGLAARAR
jgi:hypothetical protein